ncbi:hypothetical protein [Streptomyces sp. NPDC056479]|uniref:hypothetical protein n=1 Tax=unclassified Streptomyces TaxID=2593676 RepID=UPI00369123D4
MVDHVLRGHGDLTNGQWARLEPLLPLGIQGGPSACVDAAPADRRHTVADPDRSLLA